MQCPRHFRFLCSLCRIQPIMPSHVDDSSEDEFEFSGPSAQSSTAAPAATRTAAPSSNLPINRTATHLSLPRKEINQPYDEAVELSASSVESVVSADNGSPLHGKATKADVAAKRGEAGKVVDADDSDEEDDEEEDDDRTASARPSVVAASTTAASRPSPKASPKPVTASSLPATKQAAKPANSESEGEEEDESDDEQGAAVREVQHRNTSAHGTT